MVFQITDGDDSSLDPDSVTLMIDGAPAEVEVNKDGLLTTVTHTPDPPFALNAAAYRALFISAHSNAGSWKH